jgi:hypothetical protein
MGGVFGGGSAPPAPVVIDTGADAEEAARRQRLENMARTRRGRAGMIATSERGVLTPLAGGGKSLLGE